MTKKIFISFLAITVMCISLVFPKDKLSENATTLTYTYTDWNEFYIDLVEASKKDLYKYAFLRNVVNEKEVANILKETKSNTWNLISYKEMHGMDMIQAFYVVSPNGHPTVLVFANNSDASYYAISNKLVYMSFGNMYGDSGTSVKVSSTKTEQKKKLVQEFSNEEIYQKNF